MDTADTNFLYSQVEMQEQLTLSIVENPSSLSPQLVKLKHLYQQLIEHERHKGDNLRQEVSSLKLERQEMMARLGDQLHVQEELVQMARDRD